MNISQLTLVRLAQSGRHQSGTQEVPGLIPSWCNFICWIYFALLCGSLYCQHCQLCIITENSDSCATRWNASHFHVRSGRARVTDKLLSVHLIPFKFYAVNFRRKVHSHWAKANFLFDVLSFILWSFLLVFWSLLLAVNRSLERIQTKQRRKRTMTKENFSFTLDLCNLTFRVY